ncbi:MAG TPA: hypothetical protein VKG65_03505 [Terriglobales bacterium]|nr:hypothetical protein [Terriglobales bacterium]
MTDSNPLFMLDCDGNRHAEPVHNNYRCKANFPNCPYSGATSHRVRRCNLAPRTSFDCDLGQSKIKDLSVTAFGYEDIGRLDVAVDDSLGMSGVQRVGNLNRQREDNFGLYRLSRDEMLQGYAVEEFHGKERLTVLLANVENGANVEMIQRRRGLRLALESGERLRVAGDFFRQEFEGDETMQPRVLGLKYHAHAAATEFLDDAVVRDDFVKSLKGFCGLVVRPS